MLGTSGLFIAHYNSTYDSGFHALSMHGFTRVFPLFNYRQIYNHAFTLCKNLIRSSLHTYRSSTAVLVEYWNDRLRVEVIICMIC